MTASAVEPHIDAFLALLRGGSPALTVHDSLVPGEKPPLPYVVTYTDSGLATTDRLVTVSNLRDVTVQTTCVGSTATSVRAVRDRVAGRVLDHTLIVGGWRCWPIRHLTADRVRRDDDVTPPVLYGVDEWRWRAEPIYAA